MIAQYAKFADIGMGIGMIIIGLASVIIGEAIFGTKTIIRTTLAVIIGAVIYRIVLGLSLRVKFLDSGDMKLITAVIVIAALDYSAIIEKRREKAEKRKDKLNEWQMKSSEKGGKPLLKLDQINKIFNEATPDEKIALDQINLHLKPGDFVTMIGSNGAGKSTMMNMISGALTPDFGAI